MKLRLRPEAELDMLDAAAWYETEREGLGVSFLQHASLTLRKIEQHPAAFPVVARSVRRAILDRFPYGVFYRLAAEDATVLAVVHLHRDARVWQSRR